MDKGLEKLEVSILIEKILSVAQDRSQTLEQLRVALKNHEENKVKELAKKLCGLT